MKVNVQKQEQTFTLALGIWVICAGFIASLALSPTLWLSDRYFPHAPVFDWIKPFPQVLQLLLYGGMLAFLAALIWQPSLHWAVAGVAAVWLIMVIQDQMRLQPWAYQYVLMIVPFWWVAKEGHHAAILSMLQAVMVAVYFWGGIHKIGSQFGALYDTVLMKSWLDGSAGFVHTVLHSGASVIPWIEIAMAVLLVFPLTRRVGVVLAWGMHLIILVWLGPFGMGINSVIWPWNLAMMILVALLFWNQKEPMLSLRAFQKTPKGLNWVAVCVVFFAGLMPVLSISGNWDRYLSFHLYSGHQQRVILVLQPSGVEKLGDAYRPFLVNDRFFPGMSELEFMPWALMELNAPFVSEDRVAYRIAHTLVERFDLTDGDAFFYRDYPLKLDTYETEEIRPSSLLLMDRFAPLSRKRF